MLFDTHCHLNFNAFDGVESQTIENAQTAGVGVFVLPGTDVVTSQKAVELTGKYPDVYAAVGIHPHHVMEFCADQKIDKLSECIDMIEKLLQSPKVVAVGEIGLDRHEYKQTKYPHYLIDNKFIHLQEDILKTQLQLAKKYKKSLILHNREASTEILKTLSDVWTDFFVYRTVLHCCEANDDLLLFAKAHHIFIGVDGDITWSKKKQRFIAQVPLDMLVLETDSPYLTPEPVRQKYTFPNKPLNITCVRDMVARVKNILPKEVEDTTTKNAYRLFGLNSK